MPRRVACPDHAPAGISPGTIGPMPPVHHVPSPYHRPRRGRVASLVVHAMGEWVRGEDGLWRHCTDHLQSLELSVHAFCLPDGRLVESVAPTEVAFHAGEHNEGSVGLEVVVAGPHDLASLHRRMAAVDDPPYTAVQYAAAGAWLRHRAEEAGLGFGDVTTHAELDPERKEDPGAAFDLERLRRAFEEAA